MNRSLTLIALVSLAVTACSAEFSIGGTSPEKAAETIIESEIPAQLGLTSLDATCDEVDQPEVGSTFACTATTDDGRVVRLTTVIDREDHIDVTTVNALNADDLARLEASGAEVLGAQVGVDLAADSIDCGDDAVILPDDGVMVCAFFPPGTDEVRDATYEITDLDTGTFNLAISETPRG